MMENKNLELEYDKIFDGADKVSHALGLKHGSFALRREVLKTRSIDVALPLKKGREKTLRGLTKSIKELGVLTPIHVFPLAGGEDEEQMYGVIDGFRRLYGALRNGLEEIDAIVWDFKDVRGADISLILGLFLNRCQQRDISEVWSLVQVLEKRYNSVPGLIEYLLQLHGGDVMKLKDIMLSGYDEVVDVLLSGKKDLEGAYRLLVKLRREADSDEDTVGLTDVASEVKGVEKVVGDGVKSGSPGLSDSDVRELLEMADKGLSGVESGDFSEFNAGDVEVQDTKERHPLNKELKAAVLRRDDFKCQCCGFGGPAALGVLAVHHVIPVSAGGPDTEENLKVLCVNHHLLLHIAERNGGKLHMSEEEFKTYSPKEQDDLKKVLSLAKVAYEAGKRKKMSKREQDKIFRANTRHPMPGEGLAEVTAMYDAAKK